MDTHKLRAIIDTINSYYAFAVLLYTVVLFAATNNVLFFWILVGLTPLLTAWSGYLLRGLYARHRYHHGFEILSLDMTYELLGKRQYQLRYATELKAGEDHLMVYPLSYQWSGSGDVSIPKLTEKGQRILALTEPDRKTGGVRPVPYAYSSSTVGDWQAWFVSFNPPVQSGQKVKIHYSQDFYDAKGTAQPWVYYSASYPMKRLTLKVKFPDGTLPSSVQAVYTKPSDSRRPFDGKGLRYDPDIGVASWVIEKPKRGYYYRIEWTW
jgi:hypothetical protein